VKPDLTTAESPHRPIAVSANLLRCAAKGWLLLPTSKKGGSADIYRCRRTNLTEKGASEFRDFQR